MATLRQPEIILGARLNLIFHLVSIPIQDTLFWFCNTARIMPRTGFKIMNDRAGPLSCSESLKRLSRHIFYTHVQLAGQIELPKPSIRETKQPQPHIPTPGWMSRLLQASSSLGLASACMQMQDRNLAEWAERLHQSSGIHSSPHEKFAYPAQTTCRPCQCPGETFSDNATRHL